MNSTQNNSNPAVMSEEDEICAIRKEIRDMLFGFGDVRNPRDDTVTILANLAFEQIFRLIKYGTKVCKTKKLTLDGCYFIALTNDNYFAKISSQLRHFEQVEHVLSDFTLKGPSEFQLE